MREILFRGQSIDSHRWVEGYYAKAKDIITDKETHILFSPDLELFPHSEFSSYEEIVPETLEQCIGMTDVFGTKIFEGDIVKYYCYGIDRPDKYELKMVEWVDECCGFEPFSDSRENCGHCGGGIDPKWCEVIGNVHNSLEFLKNAVMRVDSEDLNQLGSILETYAKKQKEK